jgi:hypothetical protein
MRCVYNIETGEKDEKGKSICPITHEYGNIKENNISSFCELCPHRLKAEHKVEPKAGSVN